MEKLEIKIEGKQLEELMEKMGANDADDLVFQVSVKSEKTKRIETEDGSNFMLRMGHCGGGVYSPFC